MMMDHQPEQKDSGNTRQRLLEVAGELFAEHGLEGTSVRAIAEKAGANIAAVNYHYGSKEKLYYEALRYSFVEGLEISTSDMLMIPEQATRQDYANILFKWVKTMFDHYLSPDHPTWPARLVMRGFFESNPVLLTVIDENIRPRNEKIRQLLKQCDPNMSDEKAHLWIHSLMGPIIFYVFSKVPILHFMGKQEYDKDFLEAAARHITLTATIALGLPEPEFDKGE